ncbi:MAG: family 78 glycoside hydrolase catalytic domain [Bacteroidota bacterium]|nr:family 78 glycoside hydrolase catalytic domain [Bacteroidota bacterium]
MRTSKLLFVLGFLLVSTTLFSQVNIDKMFCENRENPLGIDSRNPEFTWVLSSDGKNKKQLAYQIQVSSKEGNFGNTLVWDSDKVTSDQSVRVPYAGPELFSLQKYYWRVKVWDEKGKPSKWSSVRMWQMGVLNASDWKADWIAIGYKESPKQESPILRNEFQINKNIKSATVAVTSHGLYEAYLNGDKIGDAYLTPGWTSYNKRLQYQVYDVTPLLKQGKNAMSALLGSGWYRSPLAWDDNKNLYGTDLALLLQLNIEYTDGTSEILGTNKDWKSHESSIMFSEIYNGETIDRTKDLGNWKNAGYNDGNWSAVEKKDFGYANLIGTYNEPITKHETFTPIKMLTTPEGDTVLDFGQNLVGWVIVDVKGKPGDSLIIDHAEVLDKDGNFYTTNLRAAKQENIYILNGVGTEHFEPHFTWQGFRYIRIKGNLKEISKDDFKAVALYSDMRKTGSFQTSDALLNQLQHNIQWGQRGNFLDVPTDCPQRDERLGWTGDAQVFSPTAAYNMQVDNFFTKWMQDVAADQLANGSVPFVVPNVLGENASGSAGWSDVATIIPWNMYVLYGDKTILKNQYASMKSWVNFMKDKSVGNLWNTGFHFGDWLFYRPDDDNDGRAALTDKYLIAQCFFAHSTQLLINAAKVLGHDDDVREYMDLLKKIKTAFQEEYVTPSGRLVSSSQTAYVLALNFDMLPENLREQAAERLAKNVESYGYHLTTGFLGTPYLSHVLSRYGYHDLAYTLLMQQTYPSWLYPVTVGATTIWERWDGRKPDGSFQTPSMNSFNHYAYGAVGDWMYRYLGGINTSEKLDEVGYKKVILKPTFYNNYFDTKVRDENHGKTLDQVNASLDTNYGKIVSHWEIKDGTIVYNVTIPVNTTAEVHLPQPLDSIMEGNAPISRSKYLQVVESDSNSSTLLVGSGSYTFILK